ncbi:L-rhamnose mutarotase [Cupriavidus pinatubonensis]|uniref:L-fucose mutarotase n=1 Tax=Cupriavidus pinatubonensis TaxID=248026 RepID=A0ABN7YTT8_9BURK|nr:L-rhamnose mutarotase [Cupriavidus pinatubonensis]CAG9176703.1 L-fucose mutarotase [Cupriavidus pinatubonensis]
MRHCLALDLRDDPGLIACYEALHQCIWPEIAEHLREHGVIGMEIWRLGNRLVMVMETDDARYDADGMARAAATNPRVREWEALMWNFQLRTPWTPPDHKWMPMTRIFDLMDQ